MKSEFRYLASKCVKIAIENRKNGQKYMRMFFSRYDKLIFNINNSVKKLGKR